MTEKKPVRVAIIEDDRGTQEFISEELKKMGVIVVAIAGNLIKATEELIPQLELLGVQLVLLDGNLNPDESLGSDGKKMAEQIRNQAPSVKIVGISSGPQSYVDTHLGLNAFDKEKLRKAILGE